MELITHFFGENSIWFHIAGILFTIVASLIAKFHFFKKRDERVPFDKKFWWKDNRLDFLIAILISFLFVRFSHILISWLNPKIEAGFSFTIPYTDDTIFYYFLIGGLVQFWIHKYYRKK